VAAPTGRVGGWVGGLELRKRGMWPSPPRRSGEGASVRPVAVMPGISGRRGARPQSEECPFAGACFLHVAARYGLGLRESQRERSFDREPAY
jgi:hypothetical protein